MKKVASVAGTVPPGPFSVAELRQESPALVIFGSIFLVQYRDVIPEIGVYFPGPFVQFSGGHF